MVRKVRSLPSRQRTWLLGMGALLLALLCPAPTAAQDVSVRAYPSPATVGMGSTFLINVEVTGSQNVDSEPQLPDMASFATYLGSGSSSSMRVVNGRSTVSLTIQYRFQALEQGTFDIPAMTVNVGGKAYVTEPFGLTVSAGQPAEPTDPGGSTAAEAVGEEDLFILAEASKTRVREGEPLVVEYRIFTLVDVNSFNFTTIPELSGFWVEELPLPDTPQVEQVVRDGKQYTTAVIRRVGLVPTGPGERTVEPLGIEAQVRMRRKSRDPFESIFGFDRSSLFGTVVPTTVLSNPINVYVAPLPAGRPDPFSGVVGSLALTVSLDRDSVEANQAVTLTVRAQGEGNLKGIPDPNLDLPGDFEAYPPEVTESSQRSGTGLRGTKTWEYVLIPRAPGIRTVPSVSAAYFDTGSDEYRTAETGPLSLIVSGQPVEGPSALVRGGVETLREDIRFIHLAPPRLAPAGHSLFTGGAFWTLLLLPMAALLGALVLRSHQDRLEGDPAWARRRKAGRVAHTRLAEARRKAGGEAPREFYAEVAMALRGFIADKVNIAEAGMQMADVEEGLQDEGVSEAVAGEVVACLEHCDRQRFAPPKSDPGEETRFLERVANVMTALNREMGR
jgi:hypothetical protein